MYRRTLLKAITATSARFVRSQGLHAVHIPYRGSVEIVPAQLGGDVHFALPVSSTAMPAIRTGKVRPLAVAGGQRILSLPDVPMLRGFYESYGSGEVLSKPRPVRRLHEARADKRARIIQLTGVKPE